MTRVEKSRGLKSALLGMSALGLMGLAGVAQAAADSSDKLDEIIVSAERRPALEREVPIAVTSISGEKLDVLNSSGMDIRFLAARTPSLQAESSFGRTYPRFYIRGLGNADFDPNASQPVSVVFDDVAMENPMLKAFPVFDVAAVEVLRGPQGTLFGKNTPAGVVKIDSAKPTDTFSGFSDLTYGSYDTVNFTGAVSGPIVKNVLKYRASVNMQRRNDWVQNQDISTKNDTDFEGYRDLAGRFQLEYTPNENLDVLLNVHGRQLDGSARLFRANIIKKGTNDLVDGFDIEKANQDGANPQKLNSFGSNLHVVYDAGPLTITSVSGYERANVFSRGDIDGGVPADVPFSVETGGYNSPRELSQEVRVATNDLGPWLLQGGLYYFNSYMTGKDYDYVTSTGAIDDQVRHKDRSETDGVFGSVKYKVTDALTLGGGVRYSHDNKSVESIRDFGYTGPIYLRTSVNGGNASWDVSADYAVTSDVNAFVRVATGYLAPSIQDRITFANATSTAKAETTISYEAGIKSSLFQKRASLNLTGYYYDTSDMQLTAVGGASNTARLLNADHAIGYGVELEIEAKPIEHLLVTAGGSYNHTEIQDPTVSVATCGGGCTVTNRLNASGNALLDGNPLPEAPKWILNATLRYGVPVGADGEVFFFTDWAYRGEDNFFLYTAKEFTGKAFLDGGLRIGYKNDAGYEVAGFVRNVLDQVRVIGAIDFNNLTGMVNEPRIFGVQAKYSF
ncbi:TonB-dependent receptor [Azospirillum sp. B4]|uniref:TonB-dependent receptor n=1 Tax=Azospirillum sp. B4 TaxID=95605 RepID=UPI000348002A|nr:TonB-dependent receptor [Azospirillum sp. B4]